MERFDLPGQQGGKDHSMISIVHCSYQCVCVGCVGWGRTLHPFNGGAGAFHCLPRVRIEQKIKKQRGGGGEEREKNTSGRER